MKIAEMSKLREVIGRMRHFDFEDDVYDCHEVMNGFADDVENAWSHDCSACSLLVEDRKLIDELKSKNSELKDWIISNCDAKERNMTCAECLNHNCPCNINSKK